MPMWRNWQTHQTQNLAGNHVGSSPTIGTNSIGVREDFYFYMEKLENEKVILIQGAMEIEVQCIINSLENKKSEKLTDFSMGVDAPVLSPDNQLIAFTAKVYPECGADSKANKMADSIASNGPVQAYLADHLLYRHWTEYSAGKCSHIILFDIAKKTYKDLTPGSFE